MAVQALPISTKISQSSSKEVKANILIAQYGDGYEQRIPNGINYYKQNWSIQWDNLTNAEIKTIETVIANARYGADYFTWIPFNETISLKFKYMGHKVSYDSGNHGTIQLTLNQVYDL